MHRAETRGTAALVPALQLTCVSGLGLPSPQQPCPQQRLDFLGATCPKRQGGEARITSPSKFTKSENSISFQSGPAYQKHRGLPAVITEERRAATAPAPDALKVAIGPVTFSPHLLGQALLQSSGVCPGPGPDFQAGTSVLPLRASSDSDGPSSSQEVALASIFKA